MRLPRVRAVVLAAGLATRLRPLTEFVPKALVPAAGRPLLAHTLARLAASGCEAAAINLHHHGEQVRRAFGDAFDGMPLTYSPEERLLGTLGALGPLQGFLRGAEVVLVLNGDCLCRWPLRKLVRRHRQRGARATLLCTTRGDLREYGGGLGLDLEGRVVSTGSGGEFGEIDRRRVFAGAHALSPELVAGVEVKPADFIRDLYEPMLARGETVRAVETSTAWFELGTPERYLEGVRGWARGRWPAQLAWRSWVASDARVDATARVRRSVVEAGARVAAGAEVESSLVLPAASVGGGARVANSILGPGVQLPPGTRVERRLVTSERADVTPRDGDSVVGGLVYSPMRPSPRRVREYEADERA